MNEMDRQNIRTDIAVIMRDLNFILEKLDKYAGTPYEPNISETRNLRLKLQTIKKKISNLSHENW